MVRLGGDEGGNEDESNSIENIIGDSTGAIIDSNKERNSFFNPSKRIGIFIKIFNISIFSLKYNSNQCDIKNVAILMFSKKQYNKMKLLQYSRWAEINVPMRGYGISMLEIKSIRVSVVKNLT